LSSNKAAQIIHSRHRPNNQWQTACTEAALYSINHK